MRLGRRHLSGACHGWRRRGHRLLSPCTLGGGRASLVCAAQVLSEKRTEHLLHRAGRRGAESRMQELGVVLGLVGLQMLEVRQRRLFEERIGFSQLLLTLHAGTRISPPDRAVLRAYARVAESSVVPLAVEVRERRKLESHEAQRGARGLRDGHGTEAAGGAFDFGTGYKPFWIQFQNARPPENEHTEFGTLPIWIKSAVSAGKQAKARWQRG